MCYCDASLGVHCLHLVLQRLQDLVCGLWELSKLASLQTLGPGARLRQPPRLSAHLGLELLSDNDSDQGFVNSFLVFFSSVYKCICFV